MQTHCVCVYVYAWDVLFDFVWFCFTGCTFQSCIISIEHRMRKARQRISQKNGMKLQQNECKSKTNTIDKAMLNAHTGAFTWWIFTVFVCHILLCCHAIDVEWVWVPSVLCMYLCIRQSYWILCDVYIHCRGASKQSLRETGIIWSCIVRTVN